MPLNSVERLKAVTDLLESCFKGSTDTAAGEQLLKWHVSLLEDDAEFIAGFLADPSFKAQPFVFEHAGRSCGGSEEQAREWLKELSRALPAYVEAQLASSALFESGLPPVLIGLADKLEVQHLPPGDVTPEEKAALRQALADPSFDAAAFCRLTVRHVLLHDPEAARAYLAELAA